MLKFIKEHMATIGDIEIYPVISFLIFFAFFIVTTILVVRSDRKFISKMGNLPLEDSSNEEIELNKYHTKD